MSDTPRTDAQVVNNLDHAKYKVDIDFARQLERELNEAVGLLHKLADIPIEDFGWDEKDMRGFDVLGCALIR